MVYITPRIPIWLYLGGLLNGKCWNNLLSFEKFNGLMEYSGNPEKIIHTYYSGCQCVNNAQTMNGRSLTEVRQGYPGQGKIVMLLLIILL
jgi:hypothetical protein